MHVDVQYTKCVSTPSSLLYNSNNYPFLNSMISANHEKWGGISANREILIPLIVPLV